MYLWYQDVRVEEDLLRCLRSSWSWPSHCGAMLLQQQRPFTPHPKSSRMTFQLPVGFPPVPCSFQYCGVSTPGRTTRSRAANRPLKGNLALYFFSSNPALRLCDWPHSAKSLLLCSTSRIYIVNICFSLYEGVYKRCVEMRILATYDQKSDHSAWSTSDVFLINVLDSLIVFTSRPPRHGDLAPL